MGLKFVAVQEDLDDQMMIVAKGAWNSPRRAFVKGKRSDFEAQLRCPCTLAALANKDLSPLLVMKEMPRIILS